MVYLCVFCGIEKNTFFRYCRHLRLYHEKLPNFLVMCNVQGCKDTFTAVRYLVRHVRNKHSHITVDDDGIDIVDEECEQIVDDSSDINDTSDDTPGSNHVDSMFTVSNLDKTVQDFEKHLILCVLKLREKHMLPSVHDTYKSVFTAFCEENNILSPLTGMGRFLGHSTSLFNVTFENIDSDYKLDKAVHANFAVADPSEFSLGFDSNGKPATFVYVSVSSVLQQMLGNDDIRDHILSNNNDLSCSDTMSSFKDGSIYENHLFFSKNRDALRLHLYLDEFEVCNHWCQARKAQSSWCVLFGWEPELSILVSNEIYSSLYSGSLLVHTCSGECLCKGFSTFN
jgi:hypothetical protein